MTHHGQLQRLLQDLIEEEFPSLLIEQTLSIRPCDHKCMIELYFYADDIFLQKRNCFDEFVIALP